MKQKFVVNAGISDHVGEGGSSTSAAKVNIEDRAAMSCCQNALVHSVVMLSNHTNYRVAQCVITCAKELISHYTEASKACRSPDGNLAWFVGQP